MNYRIEAITLPVYHYGPEGHAPGVDPAHGYYGSYASFADPDGNTWLLQEVPSRT